MKRTIRAGVLETNSSSTHSLTITDMEVYDKWKNGELFYSPLNRKFYTREEAIARLDPADVAAADDDEYELEEALKEEYIFTFDGYERYVEDYEKLSAEHTTPSGDEVFSNSGISNPSPSGDYFSSTLSIGCWDVVLYFFLVAVHGIFFNLPKIGLLSTGSKEYS